MSSIPSEEPRKDYKFPMIWLDPVEFDMMDDLKRQTMTYKKLDKLLIHLGFTCNKIESKWLRYENSPSNTEIILIEKGPDEVVRESDAEAIRAQLTTNKLMTKTEIRDFLMDCHESAE